ncbi:PTS fructose transporter subunit IIB [Enterococcus camelliae]|uniref:PTS fructose transporter subunit IIB n=1 Tax=Enterococcus camelliae TaxID=453959 RepID=A0ABW5THX5_9ENTE
MKIVGVTACPTGIAHTYMAQELLENEGKKRGIEIKIETQGSIGIENELTQEEIDEADVVILAIAVMIEGEERFEEKLIYNADVNESIAHPNLVIDEAIRLISKNAD